MSSEHELGSLLETAHLLRSPKNARRLLTALERALEGPSTVASTVGELRQEFGLEAESDAEKATG